VGDPEWLSARRIREDRERVRRVFDRLRKQFPELSEEELLRAIRGQYENVSASTDCER
jgi:hypothetical protein